MVSKAPTASAARQASSRWVRQLVLCRARGLRGQGASARRTVTGVPSGVSAVLTTSTRPSGNRSTPTRQAPGGVPATAAAIAPTGAGKPSSAAEAERRCWWSAASGHSPSTTRSASFTRSDSGSRVTKPAFARHSAHSEAAVLSATMPDPTPKRPRPSSSSSSVRMATLRRSRHPSCPGAGSIVPMPPV